MHCKPRRLSHFDARSVLLFTALALGGAAALHAQTANDKKPLAAFGPASAATQPASEAAAPPKFAIGPKASVDAALAKADANRDGKPSAPEAAALPAIGNHFPPLDTDRDGFLSREEFQKGTKS